MREVLGPDGIRSVGRGTPLGLRRPVIEADPVGRTVGEAQLAEEPTHRGRRWAIVLAGGRGTRLQPLVQAWLGYARPKQFCAFVGERSMLEHTLDRARRLVPASRILTLIGPGQGVYLPRRCDPGLHGDVLEQPRELDTAPAVLLATTRVLTRDPEGTVLVFPSDHYIHPEDRFVDLVDRAAALAAEVGDKIVLLGAVPDRPETDYGWIAPGRPAPVSGAVEIDARTVLRFTEKPEPHTAIRYYRADFLWNTLIVASKARTMWTLARRFLPRMSRRLGKLANAIRSFSGSPAESHRVRKALSRSYSGMRPTNLSTALLEKVVSDSLVVPMTGVEWSDWGRPERIVETLERIGREPAFSVERLDRFGRESRTGAQSA